MIDITTIQTFQVLPQLQVLNTENIALKKRNEGIITLISTILCLSVGVGLFIIIKKHNEEYRK